MKERPILFSAPMVRSLLAGTKTQTRRVLKQATGLSLSVGMDDNQPGVAELSWLWGDGPGHDVHETIKRVSCPYGQPGDRLWVREAWADCDKLVRYYADEDVHPLRRKRPSIHMPRWASRITLEVTDVRVERAQDISETDAMAEGIVAVVEGYGLPDGSHFHAADPRISYWSLLDSINGPGFVESNPWLWAVTFKKVTT